MKRLQSIQILRLVAACLVIIVHATETWSLGFVGVDIFFVISGFVITRMMPGRTAGQFIRGRLTRIYPFYWLMLLPKALETIAEGQWGISRALTSLTLWPAFGDIQFPYLILGWTLSFEMLFYVGAALILLDRRSLIALPLIFLAAMAGAFVTSHPVLRFIGNPLVLEFGLGVVVAAWPYRSEVAGALAMPVAAALILVATTWSLGIPERAFDLSEPLRPIVWGIPAAMLVWGAMQFEDRLKGRVVAALSYGGDASYSIYLSHGLTLWPLKALMPWPVAAIWSIVAGIGVYRYVELPLLRAVRRKPDVKAELFTEAAPPSP